MMNTKKICDDQRDLLEKILSLLSQDDPNIKSAIVLSLLGLKKLEYAKEARILKLEKKIS